MKKIRDLQRLFERQGLLLEDTDDGGWFDDYIGGGSGDDGGGDLFKTFVQPFTDVVDTTAASVSSLSSKVTLGVGVLTRAVLGMVIPFIAQDFEKIFDADSKRQNKIKEKYKDVFKRTDDALFSSGGNYDGAGVISVLFPHYAVTKNLAGLATRLAGPPAESIAKSVYDIWGELVPSGLGKDFQRRVFGQYSVSENYIQGRLQRGLYLIVEDEDKRGGDYNKKFVDATIKLAGDPRILKKLEKSDKIQELRSDGLELIKQTVTELATVALKRIEQFNSVNSIEELEKLVGKDLNLTPKEGEPMDPKDAQKLFNDTMPKINQEISTGFMNAAEEYKNKLIKSAQDLGVDDKGQLEIIANAIEEVPEYKKLASLAKK